jgi:hypothetical protein
MVLKGTDARATAVIVTTTAKTAAIRSSADRVAASGRKLSTPSSSATRAITFTIATTR